MKLKKQTQLDHGIRAVWLSIAILSMVFLLSMVNPAFATNPCTDPLANCYTDAQGNRFCGYPGQTSTWCGNSGASSFPPSTPSYPSYPSPNPNQCWNNPSFAGCIANCLQQPYYTPTVGQTICAWNCQALNNCNVPFP